MLAGPRISLGTGLALAVGPIGRDMEINTDTKFRSAVYAYSRTKGLYAGLNFEGARLRPRIDANQALWPSKEIAEVLTSNFDRVGSLSSLTGFAEELERHAPTSPALVSFE